MSAANTCQICESSHYSLYKPEQFYKLKVPSLIEGCEFNIRVIAKIFSWAQKELEVCQKKLSRIENGKLEILNCEKKASRLEKNYRVVKYYENLAHTIQKIVSLKIDSKSSKLLDSTDQELLKQLGQLVTIEKALNLQIRQFSSIMPTFHQTCTQYMYALIEGHEMPALVEDFYPDYYHLDYGIETGVIPLLKNNTKEAKKELAKLLPAIELVPEEEEKSDPETAAHVVTDENLLKTAVRAAVSANDLD